MSQPSGKDIHHPDMLAIENSLQLQQSLINLPNDWNLVEAIPQQGTSSNENREFSYAALPYSFLPMHGSFTDSPNNVGYQYSSNQYNTSSCCLLDASKRQLDSNPAKLLSDLANSSFVKELMNSYSQTENVSNHGMVLTQPHNSYSASYTPQDALHYPQYSTNITTNCNLCGDIECTDKICSPSKNTNFSSCLLDQNPIDIESIEPEDVPKDSNDLSTDFNPLIEAVNEKLLRNCESDNDSDIVVEDSDNESEISIDVGLYIEDKEIEVAVMRCFVCNLSYSEQYGSHFVQVNSSFPVTFITQTPVMLKLIEIIPTDMQSSVKFENNLICRRCLSLIDTIESLEARLVNVKKAICDFVCHSSKDGLEVLNVFQETTVIDVNSDANIDKDIEPTESNKSTENHESIEKQTALVNKGVNTEMTEEPAKSSNPPTEAENVDVVSITPETFVEKSYQCERCGRMFKSEKRLDIHLRHHDGHFKVKCPECGKGFVNPINLEKHLRKHYKWSCVGCRACFKTEDELMEHLAKCADTKFPCEKCPVVLLTHKTLLSHMKTHTEKRVCNICSKSFKHPSRLEAHLQSHLNIKPFSCEKCGKTYKNISHLRRHEKNHTMSYHCSVCNGKFPTQGELQIHLASHPDRVMCDLCDKSFYNRYKMLEHRKIHNGTQPKKECPFCKKTFVSNFKAHVKSHDDKHVFTCEICDIPFTFKVSLMKHIKKQHSGNALTSCNAILHSNNALPKLNTIVDNKNELPCLNANVNSDNVLPSLNAIVHGGNALPSLNVIVNSGSGLPCLNSIVDVDKP